MFKAAKYKTDNAKLRSQLSGKADHLAAVEKELAKLKAQLAGYRSSEPVALVRCCDCAYESRCCGLGMLDMPEDELEFQSTSSVWRTTRGQQKARGTAAGFQSTSSVWRTTTSSYQKRPPRLISIHVLRVEDDPHFNA